jgi:exosortase
VQQSLAGRLAIGLGGAAMVAVYAPTAVWLWGRWTISVWHNAHGALIPPIVAYLCYTELKRRPHLPVSSSVWGFALLVPALILHALDTAMHTGLLSAASIVLALPGLSLLFLGVERTKVILFPLAFMLFALPIPLSLTERLHLVLRHIGANATAAIAPFLGVPVYVSGTTLNMDMTTLEVGDACSGFSTLYAAAAMACLIAYGADTWKRRLLVLLSAAPLAVAANVLRILLLVAIVDRTGVDVLETWIHPASGMLTFALALPVIMWLGQPGASPAPKTTPTSTVSASSPSAVAAAETADTKATDVTTAP